MFYTIYKITNSVNGKIYIGKHQTKDLEDGYMGSGKRLKNAIKRHGIDAFEKEILFLFDNESDMNAKEAELVTEKFCMRKDTYNLCPGGHGGFGYINSNEEILSKRDTYENKLKGRIAANEVIAQNFGSTYNQTRIAGLAGAAAYSLKFKNDEEFRNKRIAILKEANEKSQSKESKLKRKQTMRDKGHSKGSKNPQFGKMWIHSLTEKKSKMIDKNDSIPEGWSKGRKLQF